MPQTKMSESRELKTLSGILNEPNLKGSSDLENGAPKKYFESDAGDGSTAISQHLTGLPLALTIISCVASIFLVCLDTTIVTTIVTQIGNQFHSFNRIGWLQSGMLIAVATLTPSYGKISIVFGRKHLCLAGIAIFEIGSLVCALANSMDMLIGGRVIQGLGGGAIMSMVQVILTEIVPIDKRSLLLMAIGMTFSIASVLGPFIGGAFAQHTTWRWCFYVNLPIGGVAAALLVLFFHPPKARGGMKEKFMKIDYLGTFLMATGLVLILLALTFGGVDYPWKSAAVILNFILGALFLVAFSVWNFKYSKNPILLKELVVSPQILAGCFSGSFSYCVFIILLTYLASYFQIMFKASAWSSGIHLIPLLIAFTLSSIVNSLVIKKTKIVKPFLMASCILGPVGVGVLLLLGVDSGQGKKIGCIIPVGVLIGLMFQPSLISSQLLAPREIEGSVILVTVLLNFIRITAAAITVTLAQLIYQTAGLKNLQKLITSLPNDSSNFQTLSKFTPAQLIASPDIIEALDSVTRRLVLVEVMKSFKDIFYFCMGLAVLSLVCGIFVTNKRIPKDVATKEKTGKGDVDVATKEKAGQGNIDDVKDGEEANAELSSKDDEEPEVGVK